MTEKLKKIVPLVLAGHSWKEIAGNNPELVNTELKTSPTQQVRNVVEKFLKEVGDKEVVEVLQNAMSKMKSSKGRSKGEISASVVADVRELCGL